MQMIDWIKEIMSSLIWDSIAGASQNLFEFFIKFINTLIVQPTEPGKYITNFDQYLKGVQYFAGGLLVIFVILAVFRQISGVMYQSERSMGTYFIHVTIAGGLIYVLPKVVTFILLPLNNAFISFIGSVGVDASRIEAGGFKKYLGGGFGYFRIGSTHYTCYGYGTHRVGYNQHRRVQFPFIIVKSGNRFIITGAADDYFVAAQFFEIERV